MRAEFSAKQNNMMNDFMEFMRETAIPEDRNEYWTDLLHKGEALLNKYGGVKNEFLMEMIFAWNKSLERKAKRGDIG